MANPFTKKKKVYQRKTAQDMHKDKWEQKGAQKPEKQNKDWEVHIKSWIIILKGYAKIVYEIFKQNLIPSQI